MDTERAGWYIALITGVLAVLTFFGLDKQSRAWVCRHSEGKYLCDPVQIEDVQVKFFALDYCYLHPEECPNGQSISAAPLAADPVAMQIEAGLRSIDNPDWQNQPPDNLRFYVPSRMFPHGTSRKYLLYWELDFQPVELDHSVTVRIKPYLYLPPPSNAEGYYGNPYDQDYLAANTVDFVLEPGHTQASHLLTTAAPSFGRMDDVNEWPMGEYGVKFELESTQAIFPHHLNIGDTFTIYPYASYPASLPADGQDAGNRY